MPEKSRPKENATFAELLGSVETIKKPACSSAFGKTRKPRRTLRRCTQEERLPQRGRQGGEIDENFAAIPASLFAAMGSGKARCRRFVDLHGLFVDEAVKRLRDALSMRRNQELCLWMIVHGKGKHSPYYDRAPLKHAVIDLLRRHPAVAAIRALRDRDRQSGAVVIALQPRDSAF